MASSILITGGAGFVGSHLAIDLKRAFASARIMCMDNLHRRGSELNVPRLRDAGVEFYRGDIREPGAFPGGQWEYIVECSAEPSVMAGLDGSVDYLFHTNLTGAYHCLEKARIWGSRLIFISTSRVYPIAPLLEHPWEETETRFEWKNTESSDISRQGVGESLRMEGAKSLYGFTKYAAEMAIEEYREAFGLQAVVNRYGVIAGPWQMGKVDQGVLALWVMRHYFGMPLCYIGFGGKGKQTRDVLHVADVSELTVEQIRNFGEWEGWRGNVAGGRDISFSLLELTNACREIVGRSTEIGERPENRPADLRIFLGDCARLFERTSWRPKRGVREIVADAAKWTEENERALEPLVRISKEVC